MSLKPVILIIDDDIKGELQALPIILEMQGYSVFTAIGYSEAEDKIMDLKKENIIPAVAIVDMILADIDPRDTTKVPLPREGGSLVIKLLRTEFPETSILLLTVVAKDIIAKETQASVNLTRNKPLDTDKLLSDIKQLVELHKTNLANQPSED